MKTNSTKDFKQLDDLINEVKQIDASIIKHSSTCLTAKMLKLMIIELHKNLSLQSNFINEIITCQLYPFLDSLFMPNIISNYQFFYYELNNICKIYPEGADTLKIVMYTTFKEELEDVL